MTCRCHICGRKDCGHRLGHSSYARVGIQEDRSDKTIDHRLRRRREQRTWRHELVDDDPVGIEIIGVKR